MGYSKLPSFVLGFHGCDKKLKENLILGKTTLKPSENIWDWLGSGIYFWENDPDRALSWAKHIKEDPSAKNPIETPDVVGAIIDLGLCLNLFDEESLKLVKDTYKNLKATGKYLPQNTGEDLYKRNLDCAVINALHRYRKENSKEMFDTVRAPFWEGKELYNNAGFREKNHVQICVVNPKCIKGYFNPINKDKILNTSY